MNLFFEQHYPHPIEKVWAALTTSAALEQWLMRNDFRPIAGSDCVFRFCPSDGIAEHLVYVTVTELDPPQRMVWRWRHENETEATTVVFELVAIEGGTTLRLRHSGDTPPFITDELERGWPIKLESLGKYLRA